MWPATALSFILFKYYICMFFQTICSLKNLNSNNLFYEYNLLSKK
jgi:hypothetical protein